MNRSLRLLSAAIAMALLAACGAKGPLFLPEKPAPETEVPVEPAAEGTETAPADSTDSTGTATPPAEPTAEPANPPSTP